MSPELKLIDMKGLSENIEKDLNDNFIFNKFGLVNIGALRARTGTTLKSKELKKLIKERFATEMVGGKIEFIDEKK